jgi:Flp pilus assembly protein TadD
MTTLAQELGFTSAQAVAIADKGYDLAEAGDVDGALVIFEGLLVLNPGDGSLHAARGAVLHQQQRLSEAEACYDAALELDPGAMLARCNRGELRVGRGDARGIHDLEIAASSDSQVRERARRLLKSLGR